MAGVIVAVLLFAAGGALGRACDGGLVRLAERDLARSLRDNVHPIEAEESVHRVDIADAHARSLAALREAGGTFTPVTGQLDHGVPIEPSLALAIRRGDIASRAKEVGQVLRIDALPASTHSDFSQSFLTHTATKDLIARLKGLRYAVYVDTTMTLGGASGEHVRASRSIHLDPEASFADFAHEAHHALFQELGLDTFAKRAQDELSQGRKLPQPGAKAHEYGEERLARLTDLLRRGYPPLAAEEAMSVAEELAGIGLSPPWSAKALKGSSLSEDQRAEATHGVKYANKHLLTELAKLAESRSLTAAERRLWLEAIRLHADLDPKFTQSAANRAAQVYRFTLQAPRRRRALVGASAAGGAVIGTVSWELGTWIVSLAGGQKIVLDADDDDEKRKEHAAKEPAQ